MSPGFRDTRTPELLFFGNEKFYRIPLISSILSYPFFSR